MTGGPLQVTCPETLDNSHSLFASHNSISEGQRRRPSARTVTGQSLPVIAAIHTSWYEPRPAIEAIY